VPSQQTLWKYSMGPAAAAFLAKWIAKYRHLATLDFKHSNCQVILLRWQAIGLRATLIAVIWIIPTVPRLRLCHLLISRV
jgi:hypothetical protein